MDIVLIGGGTLAKFVIDILSFQPKVTILGIYDDTLKVGDNIYNIPVLGSIKDLKKTKCENIVICIGNQNFRFRTFNDLKSIGFCFPNIIAHNAIVSSNALITEGCILGFNSTILSGSVLGIGSCVLSNVSINHNTKIGDYTLIGVGVNIGNDCSFGDNVHVAMGKTILPHSIIKSGEYIKWED